MESEHARRWIWLAGAVAFGAACAVLACASRFDLDPFDSAELALVAVSRGLGHPPGQPLHTALGWLLTRGPWPPLGALALLSIVPAALMVALAVVHGLRSAVSPRPIAGVLAAVIVAFLVCALPAVCEVSARVEVYALAALLSVAAVHQSLRPGGPAHWGTGVFIGLSAAANPVVAAQAVGAVLITLRRGGLRGLARLSAGVLIGLGAFAYVFAVRGREASVIVWGAPHDAHGWLRILTAEDFQRNVSLSLGTWGTNLAHLTWDLTRSGVMPFTLLGAYALWRQRDGGRDFARGWVVLAALLVGMLMIAANVPYRPRNPDYGGYLLVPVALSCAGIVRICVRDSVRNGMLALALVAAGVAGFVSALARRPTGTTRVLATAVLQDAPPDAIVVLASDHLLFPALYLQEVEHLRPDVTVLNPGWASSTWAWRYALGHDSSLQVDLTPGVGRTERLAGVLRTRRPGRAVVSESFGLLANIARGAVCTRGLLWSSSEGCADATATVDRTTALLAREWQRGSDSGWDRAMVETAGETLGNGALELGCPGIALRYFSASIARPVPAPAPTRGCDGRRIAPLPPGGFLEIQQSTLERDAEHVVRVPN